MGIDPDAGRATRWSPNPYALATALTGDLSDDEKLRFDGAKADDFLQRALLRPDMPQMLASFREFQTLAARADLESESTQISLAERMTEPLVQKAAHIFGAEEIRRALPSLMPVSDAALNQLTLGDAITSVNSRIENLANASELLIDEAPYLDPMQGDVGDCYLIATLIALAWSKPTVLADRLADAGFTPPFQSSFQWQFHNAQGAMRGRKSVTGRIPVRGGMPRYARSANVLEHWPGLIEKAFVMQNRPAQASTEEPVRSDYLRMERFSTPPNACIALIGGQAQGRIVELEQVFEHLFMDHHDPSELLFTGDGVTKLPVMAWTKEKLPITAGENARESMDTDTWTKTGLWPGHAYAVLGKMQSGHVVLRNPHGFATEMRQGYAEGPWQAGNLSVDLNTRGVFALSPEVFKQNFKHVGWVEELTS